jgi:hypothetical protein
MITALRYAGAVLAGAVTGAVILTGALYLACLSVLDTFFTLAALSAGGAP